MAKPKWLHIAGLKMGKSAYEILKFSIDFFLQIIDFLCYKLLIFLLKFRLQNIGKNIEKEVSNFNP